jgi:hypothetical protein
VEAVRDQGVITVAAQGQGQLDRLVTKARRMGLSFESWGQTAAPASPRSRSAASPSGRDDGALSGRHRSHGVGW